MHEHAKIVYDWVSKRENVGKIEERATRDPEPRLSMRTGTYVPDDVEERLVK